MNRKCSYLILIALFVVVSIVSMVIWDEGKEIGYVLTGVVLFLIGLSVSSWKIKTGCMFFGLHSVLCLVLVVFFIISYKWHPVHLLTYRDSYSFVTAVLLVQALLSVIIVSKQCSGPVPFYSQMQVRKLALYPSLELVSLGLFMVLPGADVMLINLGETFVSLITFSEASQLWDYICEADRA